MREVVNQRRISVLRTPHSALETALFLNSFRDGRLGQLAFEFLPCTRLTNKKIQPQYVAALEALKAHDCISVYSIVGDVVKSAQQVAVLVLVY